MTKRSFTAHSWLQKPQGTSDLTPKREGEPLSELEKSYRNVSNEISEDNNQYRPFQPSHYFTPGWRADSLFSKHANHIKKLQDQLWQDAKKKIRESCSFNQKLKLSIHREFLESDLFKCDESSGLGDFKFFWNEFVKENSPYKDTISQFVDLYGFRVATVYVFRLRFLITLSTELNFKFTSSQILNPSSFLIKFFKKGSSSEVNCEALRSNQYSWYRPSPELSLPLEKNALDFRRLSISQLMRLFSYRPSTNAQPLSGSDNKNYSHSLSHKDFGLFLNQLLVFFPLWLKQEKFEYPAPTPRGQFDVINTKFSGDMLESLVHSHWLAQEHNVRMKWSELLCADFAPSDPSQATFVQVCQELHFMTFLVHFSREQNKPAKETIINVMRDKYSKSQASHPQQHSLFSQQKLVHDLAYDRFVLHISSLPKKNPHHHLLNRIQAQKSSLSRHAYILVLTNQKIFVPSQSQKVQSFLEDFEIKGFFDLEKLTGKGEIPNYVYILSVKDKTSARQAHYPLNISAHTQQQSCMTFKLTGVLEHFSMFEGILDELLRFFKTKAANSSGLFHRSINDFISMQYHQDTIIDGKLLSGQNGRENITHPNFFKNLTKNCSPLEYFYQVDDLNHFQEKNIPSNFLGQTTSASDTPYQHVLITDLRNSSHAQVEVCSWSSYHSKREEYGNVYYGYFGLTPKRRNINTNLLREYFDGHLGLQIVQLCLNGPMAKLKSRVKSLLIPNFLFPQKELSHDFFHQFSLLMNASDDMLSKSPEQIRSLYEQDKNKLASIECDPWYTLSTLVHFKSSLEHIMEKLNEGPSKSFTFANPTVASALAQLKTISLHPNDEIYTEFHIDNKQQLDLPFTHTRFNKSQDQDSAPSLSLFSNDKLIATFHTDQCMLNFIDFVLSRAPGIKCYDLLKGLQVPHLSDLKEVVESYQGHHDLIASLLEDTSTLVSSNIKYHITNTY